MTGARVVEVPLAMARYVLRSVCEAGARPSGTMKMKFLGSTAAKTAWAMAPTRTEELRMFEK
jgi:hypothetical protein